MDKRIITFYFLPSSFLFLDNRKRRWTKRQQIFTFVLKTIQTEEYKKTHKKTPEEYSEDPNNRLGRYSNSAVVQFLNNLVFKKRDEQ